MKDGEEEKKEEEIPPKEKEDVDESGVSWKNRAKEYERKLEATTVRLEALESKVNTEPEKPVEDKSDKLDAEELVKMFVKDPMGFVRDITTDVFNEREKSQAQSKAVDWIQAHKEYTPDDGPRILDIVKEYNLMGLPPMERAKSTMKILMAEKAAKGEVEKSKKDIKERDRVLTENQTEGVGRKGPSASSMSRKQILEKISKTENQRELADLSELLRAVPA